MQYNTIARYDLFDSRDNNRQSFKPPTARHHSTQGNGRWYNKRQCEIAIVRSFQCRYTRTNKKLVWPPHLRGWILLQLRRLNLLWATWMILKIRIQKSAFEDAGTIKSIELSCIETTATGRYMSANYDVPTVPFRLLSHCRATCRGLLQRVQRVSAGIQSFQGFRFLWQDELSHLGQGKPWEFLKSLSKQRKFFKGRLQSASHEENEYNFVEPSPRFVHRFRPV